MFLTIKFSELLKTKYIPTFKMNSIILKKHLYCLKKMKRSSFLVVTILLNLPLFAQYTDQINSNRPGISIGAFSVGTGVIQIEAGGEYRSYKHKGYNNSVSDGSIMFLSLRWGFLLEQLELTYEGSYLADELRNKIFTPNFKYRRSGFLTNFIGVKYLVYDPFKKQAEEELNVYSWKANNSFRLRDLLPAVSITAGANFNIEENQNAYPYGDVFNLLYRPILYQNLGIPMETEPLLNFRATIATQSHFLATWVFVTNFSYNRIITDYPEMSYILTLTHTFSPKWSIYLENHGIYSDLYKDQIFRTGAAYLLTDDIQLESTIGANVKDTPSIFSVNAGISYRLDFHKDKVVQTQEEIAKQETLKKENKALKKTARGATKRGKKAQRRARKN